MARTTPIDAETVDSYTERILGTYDGADGETVAAGLAWYGRAESTIAGMAQTYGVTRDAAAGVVAVLSPRSRWSTNLQWAEAILAARGNPEAPAVSTTANRAKAWSIANGADPETVVNGPKVSAFWANLRGDSSYVTVDVWAARAAGIPMAEGEYLTRTDMRELQAAYRQAAERRGIPVAHLQAVVWVAVRGNAD